MARCGIRVRHEVRIVEVGDDGTRSEPKRIGEAETLPMAVDMAEAAGYVTLGADEGGKCRFVAEASPPHFLVSVFPR